MAVGDLLTRYDGPRRLHRVQWHVMLRTHPTLLLCFTLIGWWASAFLQGPGVAPIAWAGEELIVPPDARWEHLFTRSATLEGGLTEGPAVAPDGSIYFSDIPAGDQRGQILRFDPRSGQVSVFTADSRKANGLMFDAQGRLVACEGADFGGRAIVRWDVASGERTVLARQIAGRPFNSPNDLCLDRAGRIYFSDPRYIGPESLELEHQAVYRLEPDGQVAELTHEVEKPNGLILSPDERTLYVADTNNGSVRPDPSGPLPAKGAMRVLAFPLDAQGAVLGPPRTLVDFSPHDGCDGMTVDVRGNLYLTARGAEGPGILILDPQGQRVAHLAAPVVGAGGAERNVAPSNCCFGVGQDGSTLYVTAGVSLYRIRLKVEGYHLPWKISAAK